MSIKDYRLKTSLINVHYSEYPDSLSLLTYGCHLFKENNSSSFLLLT
jgi:hypothetical protein